MADNAGKNRKACLAVVGVLGVGILSVFLLVCFSVIGVGAYHAKHAPVPETKKHDNPRAQEEEKHKNDSPKESRVEFMNTSAKMTSIFAYESIEGLLETDITVSDDAMVIFIYTEPMSVDESIDVADGVLMTYPLICVRSGANWITGIPTKQEIDAAHNSKVLKSELLHQAGTQEDYGNIYDDYHLMVAIMQRDGDQEKCVYKLDKPKGKRQKRIFADRIKKDEDG